jgi:hypothetical protein
MELSRCCNDGILSGGLMEHGRMSLNWGILSAHTRSGVMRNFYG